MSTILEDIRKGQFAGVYLIHGEEAYLRRDRSDRLCKALMPEPDEMNFTRFTGKDIDPAQVISLGSTMPFFAERRVILVEDSGWFRAANDDMAQFVKELPDYLVLVFNEAQVDKKFRLYKAVNSAGHVEECTRLRPEALEKWIAGYLGHQGGKKISRSAASLLLDKAGDDMYLLKMEMDKLTGYVGNRDEIRDTDIEEICSVTLQDRIFDMLRAITQRDQKKALELYKDLLALKESPVKILVLLGRQFTQVLYAGELAGENLSNAELASRIGVRPFAVKKLMECARRFSPDELARAVADVAEMDEAIKTGRMNDLLAVELLIIKYSANRNQAVRNRS